MMIKMVVKFLIVCLSINPLLAYQPNHVPVSEEKKMSENGIYKLAFGLQGEQQFQKYSEEGEDKQPAGMGFYSLLWNSPPLAQVYIDLGPHSLTIPNTLSVLGTKANYDKTLQGIQIIDLNAGLNKEELVSEQEAYDAYVKMIKHINAQGWQQYFIYYSARLDKSDNLKRIMEYGEVVDPNYILSYKEWVELFNSRNSLDYTLYAPGMYLTIIINKTAVNTLSETAQNKGQVQYMVRYSFESVNYNRKNLISKSYMMSAEEFKKAYHLDLIESVKVRAEDEQREKAEGYKIDENYKDPDAWPYVK